MIAQQLSPTKRHCTRDHLLTRQRETSATSIPAERVKELLLEVALALHATRVVGWKGGAKFPKKG